MFTDFSADGFPATKLIAAVCIVVYGLELATDVQGPAAALKGFSPATGIYFGALFGPLIASEPWRVLSAVFLHASLIHIGVNMLSLVSLGRTLEPHFRSARFLLLYLMSGVLGFCATVLLRGDHAHSLGASGAIFGLLGAFIGVLIVRRNPGWRRVFVNNLIMAFLLAYFFRVDNAAHAGGFVVGLILGILLELERQPRRRDRLMTVLAAAGGLAVLASLVLSARSPVSREVRELERRDYEDRQR
jgi:membrane associated rhomboid family serine protease